MLMPPPAPLPTIMAPPIPIEDLKAEPTSPILAPLEDGGSKKRPILVTSTEEEEFYVHKLEGLRTRRARLQPVVDFINDNGLNMQEVIDYLITKVNKPIKPEPIE
jgi:hypothetical protein